MQIDTFVFQRPPQTLDHAVVDPAPFAIHADLDLCVGQHVDPVATGELTALDALLSVKPRFEPD